MLSKSLLGIEYHSARMPDDPAEDTKLSSNVTVIALPEFKFVYFEALSSTLAIMPRRLTQRRKRNLEKKNYLCMIICQR